MFCSRGFFDAYVVFIDLLKIEENKKIYSII